MATTFVRAEVRQRLVDLIDAELPDGMKCLRNEPREFEADQVWLADTIGNVDYVAFAAGLIPRDDQFSIIVVCTGSDDGETTSSAEAKVQTYAEAVMTAVTAATGPTLDGLDGVLAATVSAVDGPDTVPAGEGYASAMTVTIDVHTRITL